MWPTTKPNRTRPVTAITTFLPMEDPKKCAAFIESPYAGCAGAPASIWGALGPAAVRGHCSQGPGVVQTGVAACAAFPRSTSCSPSLSPRAPRTVDSPGGVSGRSWPARTTLEVCAEPAPCALRRRLGVPYRQDLPTGLNADGTGVGLLALITPPSACPRAPGPRFQSPHPPPP